METIYRLYNNVGDGSSKDILEAIMNNDCCYVINYYETGNDINYIDEKGETFLHKASRNDEYEMIDLLIKLGADVNKTNRYGDTPLHLAVQFKNSFVVDKLLFEKAKVNAQNLKKEAPLHIAAARGKEEILNLLIDRNAKINISDENGAKPIHYAVRSGKTSIIRSLLNSGASLNEGDDRNWNALHYACTKGDEHIIAYILRHITVNDSRNIYRETPLHLAVNHASINSVKMLIEKGYDLEAVDINGHTPLDNAIDKNKTEISDYLKEYKQSSEYKEKFLKYHLHRAVCARNYVYLEQMVNKDNVNEIDYFGKTLMYYAICVGSLGIVEFLYKNGSRIDCIDEFNQPALLIAIYNLDIKIIDFLLKNKADANQIFYNRSYLYRAVLRNNYDIVKLLIDFGANVNYIDYKHRTIYSYALDYAADDIIELLQTKKASLV